MSKVRLITLAMAFCFLGGVSVASAATPPKIPGKTYFPTADGCGFLVSDAELAKAEETTKQYWQKQSGKHWIGACLHGLVDGQGVWFDSTTSSPFSTFFEGAYVLGEDPFSERLNQKKPVYKVNLPNMYSPPPSGRFGSASPGSIDYQIMDLESPQIVISADFPVSWSAQMRSNPVFNLNDGSEGDDIVFRYSGSPPENEADSFLFTGIKFEATAKSCDDFFIFSDSKIKGCSPPGKVFDVYGVLISGLKTPGLEEGKDKFIPCPNLRSPVGCEAVWESNVGKYIDAMQRHAKLVSEKVVEQNAWLESKRKDAETVLPSSWKSFWKSNPVNREAINVALQCREITDYGPISLADAQYIQKKYSTPPCNSAVVANALLSRVGNYIGNEQLSTKTRMQQIADVEKYNRDRAQARSEAWAGFFNSMNAVLQVQLQAEQQRTNQANAQLAAQAAAANAAPAAPTYQSYSQPAASSPQSYDPSKVQTRKVHKPELDAGSCVKLVQLADGDSLSSYGSQVFSNQCGQTVEVFWCRVGDECERGTGGTWTIGAGSSWPVPSGQYRYGACLGKNSGALVRESNGSNTGRYACTGP